MMADGMPISKDKRIVMMLACFLWTIVKRDGIKRVFVSLLFLFFLLCVWLSVCLSLSTIQANCIVKFLY
jgi:hypothetical protein